VLTNGYGKTLSLMESTQAFAEVYSNPFVKTPAKLPVFPVLPSQSTYSTASGTFRTNSNGYGWIVLNPGWFMSDAFVGWASNDPGASDSVAAFGAVGTTGITTNSVYKISDFDKGTGTKAFRLVSVGLRIRYVGTNLNKAGTCYCVQTTLLDSVVGYDVGAIKQNQSWKTYPISNNVWHTQIRHIVIKDDEEWVLRNEGTLIYKSNNQLCRDMIPNILMYVSCSPDQPLEYEIQCNYEIIGRSLNYQSIIHGDPIGAQHVIGAYNTLRYQDNTTKDHSVRPTLEGSTNHTKSTILDYLKRGLGGAIEIGKKLAPIATTVLGLL